MVAGHATPRWASLMSREARGDHLVLAAVDGLPVDDREGAVSARPGAMVWPCEAQASDTLDRLAIWLAEVSAEVSLAGNGTGL